VARAIVAKAAQGMELVHDVPKVRLPRYLCKSTM